MAETSAFFSQDREASQDSRQTATPTNAAQGPTAKSKCKRPLERRRSMREKDTITCGICLDPVDERGILLRRLPTGTLARSCPHPYCFTCVMTWAERTNTCPMCKERFNAVRRVRAQSSRATRETIEVEDKDPTAENLSEDENLAAALAEDEDDFMDQGEEGERYRHGYVVDDFVVSDGSAGIIEDTDDDLEDHDDDDAWEPGDASRGRTRRSALGDGEGDSIGISTRSTRRAQRAQRESRRAGGGQRRRGVSVGEPDGTILGELKVMRRELRQLQQETARLIGSSPLRPRHRQRQPVPLSLSTRSGIPMRLRQPTSPVSVSSDSGVEMFAMASSDDKGSDEECTATGRNPMPRLQRGAGMRTSSTRQRRSPFASLANPRDASRPDRFSDENSSGMRLGGDAKERDQVEGARQSSGRERASSATASGVTLPSQTSCFATSNVMRGGDISAFAARRTDRDNEGWTPWIHRGEDTMGSRLQQATRSRTRAESSSARQRRSQHVNAASTYANRGTLREWSQRETETCSANPTAGKRESQNDECRPRTPVTGSRRAASTGSHVNLSDEDDVEWTEMSPCVGQTMRSSGASINTAGEELEHAGGTRKKRLWKESGLGSSCNTDEDEDDDDDDDELEFAWSVEKASRPRKDDDKEARRHREAGSCGRAVASPTRLVDGYQSPEPRLGRRRRDEAITSRNESSRRGAGIHPKMDVSRTRSSARTRIRSGNRALPSRQPRTSRRLTSYADVGAASDDQSVDLSITIHSSNRARSHDRTGVRQFSVRDTSCADNDEVADEMDDVEEEALESTMSSSIGSSAFTARLLERFRFKESS